MFPNFIFDEQQIIILFLVLLRMSAFVVAWPIFGVEQVPSSLKILLAVILSILVYPTLRVPAMEPGDLEKMLIWLGLKELAVGLVLGYLMRLFFFAVGIAGQMISSSMGLANGQLMNPTVGIDGGAIEQYQVTLATLFFLSINGHHLFLSGLVQSFEFIPVSLEGINLAAFSGFGAIAQQIMVLGLKMSAPVIAAILVTNLAMGILGRAVPQINVFITSIPVNILLGFFIMMLTLPLFSEEMGGLLNAMTEHFFRFVKQL